ncbi:ammonium transporter Rh type A-like [Watersipora subatra]|uniref:ammonium transporter Rh type A-like n=1 Tax=Watersipora subatra TaxID=2589382 RepID=UPI00355C0D4B
MVSCFGKSRFAVIAFTLQTIFLILFGVFAEYKYEIGAETRWFYPMFQNVHVMMFIGFGFLMSFLKRYGYFAIGVNFLIAALVLQWHIIFQGLVHLSKEHHWRISINLQSLIAADFTSAAVLISFGAIIGKTSPLQLVIMAILEVMVFVGNEYIAVEIFKATDIGGSMVVHVFGAYFGLAVSRVIYKPFHSGSANEAASYHSDMFSLIGTIFLWLYWPSFNAAIATTEEQQIRAIINTYLSLAACCLVTFAVSSLTDPRGRFNLVHVQNATLAGGVAVGTAANFMIQPWGAVLIGVLAAIISTLGFQYLQEAMDKKFGLHDSCGVNNLHGMPGITAAIIGIIAAAYGNVENYGSELVDVFPALDNSTGMARTAAQQAGFQAATLGVTLLLAIVGGLVTGAFLRWLPGLDAPKEASLFYDGKNFLLNDEETIDSMQNVSHSCLEENGETGQSKI